MSNFEIIYGGELVECEPSEGITLSDTEHYDRVEVWDSNGDITVIGFFTEEGLEILKELWYNYGEFGLTNGGESDPR
jgi:hypothetical protein